MELTFQCPRCHSVNRVNSIETVENARCQRCGAERSLHTESIADGQLHACPWCATDDLYIQKDFPQGLGLLIVVVGFAISTVFWYYRMPLITYAILLASALVDLALYYRVPDVTICYRCLSQVRGPGSNPQGRIEPFDLAVGERYRQERIRAEELRQRSGARERPAPVSDAPTGPS